VREFHCTRAKRRPLRVKERRITAREITGLAKVLKNCNDAMAPAAAWFELRGLTTVEDLKDLGDDGVIEEFTTAAGLKDLKRFVVKRLILEFEPAVAAPAPPAPAPLWIFGHLKSESINGGLGFHGRKPSHCDLTAWSTRAGVLLLKATLQGHKTGYNAWRPFVSRAIQIACRHGPRGFIFMGAQEPRELSAAVVGPSRACFVETPYPAQFTHDDFNELQPFASVNRKLVAASAEPVRWNALLD